MYELLCCCSFQANQHTSFDLQTPLRISAAQSVHFASLTPGSSQYALVEHSWYVVPVPVRAFQVRPEQSGDTLALEPVQPELVP